MINNGLLILNWEVIKDAVKSLPLFAKLWAVSLRVDYVGQVGLWILWGYESPIYAHFDPSK